MNLHAFLSDLNQRGILLKVTDGALRYTSPQGRLTTTDKAKLRDHKPAIITFIKQKEGWQPAYVCAQCGEALTLELETATTIETILAEGVAMDDAGRVTCGVCLQPQPHTFPNGQQVKKER